MSFEHTRQLLSNAANAIELPFVTGWEGAASRQGNATWGRWSIVQGEVIPAIIGQGHDRGTGMLVLQIFVHEDGGTKDFTTAADIIARKLDRKQFKGSAYGYRTVATMRLAGMFGVASRDGYQQKNVICQFQRDTYKLFGWGSLAYQGIPITFRGVPITFGPT